MYRPFKRMTSKARKRTQKKTAAAIDDVWKAILPTQTPAKRKPAKVKTSPLKSLTSTTKSSANARNNSLKKTTKLALPHTSRAKTAMPSAASFVTEVHATEFGERAFKLYVPALAKAANSPLPLLVMLHGCNQTPDDFSRGTGMNALAEEFGFLVIYPAQPRKSQINQCWNWYKRSDQARGAGEPAIIASMALHIIAEYNADPARIYIAGLSAGASTALITAIAYPDVFAAVGVHSGLPVGAAHDLPSAIFAMQHGAPGRPQSHTMPTIDFHGDADKVVDPRNGRFVASRAVEPYAHLRRTEKTSHAVGGRKYIRISHRLGLGRSFVEHWVISGAGHAWSGGNKAGSYTDPIGPDASREMVRFFLRHRTTKKLRTALRA